MKRALLVVSLLLLPLIGCSSEGEKFGPMPSDIAPLFGGGGSAPAPAPAPAQPNLPGTAASKMLQDPEGNVSDEGLEVKASNDTEAFNQCQDIAASRSSPDTIVTCLGCRRRTLTTDKFMCTVRIEYVQLPQEPQ